MEEEWTIKWWILWIKIFGDFSKDWFTEKPTILNLCNLYMTDQCSSARMKYQTMKWTFDSMSVYSTKLSIESCLHISGSEQHVEWNFHHIIMMKKRVMSDITNYAMKTINMAITKRWFEYFGWLYSKTMWSWAK